MALNQEFITKRIDENPTIADRIIIDIECPDADGCSLSDPYKVNNVTIYYVSRTYSGSNYSKYDKTTYDAKIKTDLDAAIETACLNPTTENLAEVESIRIELNNSVVVDTFYYSDAQPVLILGDSDDPAWLSSDPDEAKIIHVTTDENDEVIYCQFEVDWTPLGMREGDYFVCWTWTPNPAGESLSANKYFSLNGSTLLTTSIPTHFTNPDKYPTLMARYLPEMFKMRISQSDKTPEILQEFGLAVGKGFAFIEDLANQIIDLIDSNATHESLLPLLSNLFNIKLRTDDPTLWRRQIKRAIPLSKRKGTYLGLEEALSQAGIKLNKFSRLWQVVSKYTYQEEFVYVGEDTFTLAQTALEIDPLNFEVYYRSNDDDGWDELSYTNVELSTDEDDNLRVLTWVGDDLEINDSIRIVYQIKEVPSDAQQTIENYIRELPFADDRDERLQDYPIKNWNVRVIEEDDPLINLVIPTRHPYYDPLIYGKVRTEFPYSENIYNMEEYNGSRRDSYNPCDIGKEFMDSCSSCLSSKFTIDLEIENLSTDRILEAQDIIKEFVPFHAILHSINLTGSINEIIQSPIEDINFLINMSGSEFTISGNAQSIFNRSMKTNAQFKRDELTNVTTSVLGGTGTGLNEFIVLYAPNVNFEEIALNNTPEFTFVEILSPSANSGTYTVENAFRNTIEIVTGSVSEPVDESAFTFRISNLRAIKSLATIYKDNFIKLTDANLSFDKVKSQWDVFYESEYMDGAWKIYIPVYGTYEVVNVLPDGSIVISDDVTLPIITTTGVSYTLLDSYDNVIDNSTTGKLTIRKRGRIDFSGVIILNGDSVTLDDTHNLMDSYHEHGKNHYVLYDGTQYAFDGFVENSIEEFYINGWDNGDVSGTDDATLYQRLADIQKGYLHYKGLKLTTTDNYEIDLEIQNGENAAALFPAIDAAGDSYTLQLENNKFKENFLILINANYYAITKIDGNDIWLSGPDEIWTTTGTPVTFDILKYEKLSASVEERIDFPTPGYDFDIIDRRGNEITSQTDTVVALAAMFNAEEDEIFETMNQQEGISFSIISRDGSSKEGEI